MKNKKEINKFLTKYYLLSAFNAMYFIGSFIMIIVNEHIDNAFKITVLLSISSLIGVVFEIPSGAFADRFGRKNTLILAELLGVISSVFFLLRRNYTDFIITYVLIGLCITLKSGAMEAFIYDNMKKLHITKNYAKYQSIKSAIAQIVFALSALVSSYLVLFGYNAVIIATIIFSFVGSALVVMTIKDTHYHDKNIQKLNKDYFKILKKGFHYSFKHTTILKFILFFVMMGAFVVIIDNYSELILFHITNSLPMVPILIAIEFVIMALMQVLITKHLQKKNVRCPLWIGVVSTGLILTGFVFYNFPITYIAYVLFWTGYNITGYLLNTKKQLLIPSKLRATINSVEGFLLCLVGVIYFLTFGYIVEITSYKFGFIVLTTITLVIAIAFLFILGNDKHLRRKEAKKGI